MSEQKKSIAIWGTPPPPIGGMTLHIKRLSAHLTDNNWEVIMYNFYKPPHTDPRVVNVQNVYSWYLKLLAGSGPDVHYVITTRGGVRFLAAMMGFIKRKEVVLRVGGQSLEKGLNSGLVNKWLNVSALKLCSCFVGVNRYICDLASRYTNPHKVHHIPGFIPPRVMDTSPHAEISNFYGNADIRLVVTGIIPTPGRKDIYGMWDVINVIKHIKYHYPNRVVRCCVVTYDVSESQARAQQNFQQAIIQEKLESEILLYHNKGELWPIINASDIFLRPSYTDGDANSVREALFLKKKVVASNCVIRPSACITYPTGNIKRFARAIMDSSAQTTDTTFGDGLENLNSLLTLFNNER